MTQSIFVWRGFKFFTNKRPFSSQLGDTEFLYLNRCYGIISCANVFIGENCFQDERYGPWTSCLLKTYTKIVINLTKFYSKMKAWLKQIKEIMLETFYVDQKLFWGEKIYMSGKFLKQLIHMFLLLILLMKGFYNTCKKKINFKIWK